MITYKTFKKYWEECGYNEKEINRLWNHKNRDELFKADEEITNENYIEYEDIMKARNIIIKNRIETEKYLKEYLNELSKNLTNLSDYDILKLLEMSEYYNFIKKEVKND